MKQCVLCVAGAAALLLSCRLWVPRTVDGPRHAPGLFAVDERTISGDAHFCDGYAAINHDSTVNVVVEIPTGTTQKWEVDKETGMLQWELQDGTLRVVRYLGYPGNYGMVPRTLLDAKHGGDGDPLDVVVLGEAVPRGTVLKVRVIGLVQMVDNGEQDDKIIAVVPGAAFGELQSAEELDSAYAGVSTILATWFANYKGAGRIRVRGFVGRDSARAVLNAATAAYVNARGE